MNPPAGPFGALFGRTSKKESESSQDGTVSEETKKKAQAAKAYIERMYQNQYQSIAERSNRSDPMSLRDLHRGS